MQYLDILVKLRKVIRSINLESKRIEKEFGISIPQLLVLRYIHNQPQFQASAKQIKEYLNLNASTVSGIIQRLVIKELVTRQRPKEDRRIHLITLTAKGVEVLKKSPSTLQDKLTKRLNALSSQQINELSKNIDLLIELLDAGDLDASPLWMVKDIP